MRFVPMLSFAQIPFLILLAPWLFLRVPVRVHETLFYLTWILPPENIIYILTLSICDFAPLSWPEPLFRVQCMSILCPGFVDSESGCISSPGFLRVWVQVLKYTIIIAMMQVWYKKMRNIIGTYGSCTTVAQCSTEFDNWCELDNALKNLFVEDSKSGKR